MATDAEVKQIDVSGDGGVLKRVLQEGHGSCPPQRSKVFVHYTGRLLDGTVFDSSVERNQPFEFDLGKGRVIKGWDLGVAQMKLGEKAILTCREDYAYGKSGSPPKIPPDATLQFEVELLSFDEPEEGMEKEDWEMTFEEKLEALEKRKAKGNELYRQGKYDEAAKRYKKAVDLFDKVAFDLLSEEQKAAVTLRRSAAALNLAQASLKLSAAVDAIHACDQVLERDAGNVKALFRRGQAHLLQGNYALAKADLSAALRHEPANSEISAELDRCNAKEREYRQKEKKMFGKMFA